MDPMKNIVVGVDFSDCSANALARAAGLAACHEAALHVVHVVDRLVLDDLKQVLKKRQVEDDVRHDMVGRLQKMVEQVAPAVQTEVDVIIGSPLDGLIRKVKSVSAELLVLGTRGEGGSHDTGTLAAKAVRKAPACVLLVEPHHREPFRNVVVCIDFSDISPRLVELAGQVVAPGGQLTLLHVYSPPWHQLHYRTPTPEASPNFQAEYKIALNARLESYLDKLPPRFGDAWRARCSLRESLRTAQGVLEFVHEQQADLAVMGTTGRTNLRYIFLGSTSERVVRETPSSLLAAKPSDFHINID